MAHAEKCPLCDGTGYLGGAVFDGGNTVSVCHGCAGQGWVSVQDDNIPPWFYDPCPAIFREPVKFEYPQWEWTYPNFSIASTFLTSRDDQSDLVLQ